MSLLRMRVRNPGVGGGGGGGGGAVSGWHTLTIGGGGYVTGHDLHNDGTFVCRTDVAGGYIWNATTHRWEQLVTKQRFADISDGGSGIFEIKIAPSNSSIMYMIQAGRVRKSTDKGATWAATSFAQNWDMFPANGPLERVFQGKLAIDPANPNIVYLGGVYVDDTKTPNAGIWYTQDGGANWTHVSNTVLPRSTSAYSIAFDPLGGTLSSPTRTARIYVAVNDIGYYHSEDGGATWAAIAGSPTKCSCLVVHPVSGHVLSCDTNSFNRYRPGIGWNTDSHIINNSFYTVSVDRVNPNNVVVSRDSGQIAYSNDGGNTFGDVWWTAPPAVADDVPWLAASWGSGSNAFRAVGGFCHDPFVQDKAWFSNGIGMAYVSFTDYVWHSQTAGIEELVVESIIAPPGTGKVNMTVQDRGVFTKSTSSLDTYPSTYGPDNAWFSAGWAIDYASSNPNFLTAVVDWWGPTETSSYSTDGGTTWTHWPTYPATPGNQLGGCIAAASPTNWVFMICGGTGNVYRTKDGGSTWSLVKTVAARSQYNNSNVLAADRVTIGTFYLIDAGNCYRSTDGGDTWTAVHTGGMGAGQDTPATDRLRTVPMLGTTNTSGHLFYTAGSMYWFTQPIAGAKFRASIDGGANWLDVPGFTSVFSFNFGAPKPGWPYPTIAAAGWYNGVWGIWFCDNWDPTNFAAGTWTAIGDGYPTGLIASPVDIAADPTTYKKLYVGIGSNSFVYYQP